MTNLKEDLLYKGVSDIFFLPVILKEGEECSTESVVHTIFKEAVTGTCNTQLSAKMFAKIKDPLKKMLENVDDIRNSFHQIVEETAGRHETGRTVGWALELQLRRLIPQDLVGGRKNKEILVKNFRKSLLFGKEDVIPDSLLMDGLVTKNVVWLKCYTSPSLKQCMFGALVKWLWRVTKRLVASCFYVSNIQGAPNQLTYVPKSVWKAETDRAFNSFSHLRPLTPAEAQRLAEMRKPATLRWMPKSDGLRPILSVRNDKICPETIRAKNLVLDLVRSYNFQVNARHLHNIWRQLIEVHNQGRKLYFIACDIHDAFGSVKQDKVIQILEDEVVRLHGTNGLKKFAREIAFIKKAVKCQSVKKIKNTYLLSKGLAQGTPLSSPLCNLYLTHLDRTSLTNFVSDPENKLIRAVDDYLYVTPDRTKAQLFMDTMTCGLDGYNIKIKTSKTQTNLDGDVEVIYHGYVINTSNLEIYIKYNQGVGVSFRNSMVFKEVPTLLMEDRLVNTCHVKLNCLTLDRHYMSVEGVARNVLHTGCVLAHRLTAILELSRPCDVPESGRLVDLITRSAEAVAKRVYKIGASLARDAGKTNSTEMNSFKYLRQPEIKWVVLRAFSMVITRAAPMKKNLPDDVVMLVTELEEAAKAEVRPQIICLVYPVINNIPPQFINVDDD